MDSTTKETIDAMHEVMQKSALTFINGLKTDIYKDALETVPNIELLDDEQFDRLVNYRLSNLYDYEKKEALRMIAKKKSSLNEDNNLGLTLREEILLEIQAMIKSHNYQNK